MNKKKNQKHFYILLSRNNNKRHADVDEIRRRAKKHWGFSIVLRSVMHSGDCNVEFFIFMKQ
jgi:hypothetical protein